MVRQKKQECVLSFLERSSVSIELDPWFTCHWIAIVRGADQFRVSAVRQNHCPTLNGQEFKFALTVTETKATFTCTSRASLLFAKHKTHSIILSTSDNSFVSGIGGGLILLISSSILSKAGSYAPLMPLSCMFFTESMASNVRSVTTQNRNRGFFCSASMHAIMFSCHFTFSFYGKAEKYRDCCEAWLQKFSLAAALVIDHHKSGQQIDSGRREKSLTSRQSIHRFQYYQLSRLVVLS